MLLSGVVRCVHLNRTKAHPNALGTGYVDRTKAPQGTS